MPREDHYFWQSTEALTDKLGAIQAPYVVILLIYT